MDSEKLNQKKIFSHFLGSLSDLNIIQQTSDHTFEINIDNDKIVLNFAEKAFYIKQNSKNFSSSISYDLGISKFFTAQKGVFKALESLLKNINDKKTFGIFLSTWKKNVQKALDFHQQEIQEIKIRRKLAEHYLEPSCSEIDSEIGYEHLLNKVQREMIAIFKSMGYKLIEERELEDEYHNFEALNIDASHPARENQDSFYVGSNMLMRTHTSSTQIRMMENMLKNGKEPPVAVISPGVCYRRDAVDATHFPVFRQMEGLVIDKNVCFADLKGTLLAWAKATFGSKTEIRLRPDYFPFTEPSAELSVSIPDFLDGRWIELLGCGMVHPEVFRRVGLDPTVWKGFAFGTGIERITMMKYGIKDIRIFFENDLRFLQKSL